MKECSVAKLVKKKKKRKTENCKKWPQFKKNWVIEGSLGKLGWEFWNVHQKMLYLLASIWFLLHGKYVL